MPLLQKVAKRSSKNHPPFDFCGLEVRGDSPAFCVGLLLLLIEFSYPFIRIYLFEVVDDFRGEELVDDGMVLVDNSLSDVGGSDDDTVFGLDDLSIGEDVGDLWVV